jgi:hypothetical protein
MLVLELSLLNGVQTYQRFLTLTEYGGGGQKGYLVILQGKEGKGWSGFSCELHKVS